MSSLDNSFFNELSLFKKKLSFVFQYNTNELTPIYVLYSCDSNKTAIATKKKIMKLFTQAGINLKEVIKKDKNKKENLGGSYKFKIAEKYKKPKTRGDKNYNKRNKKK